jgi:hypothetical protein
MLGEKAAVSWAECTKRAAEECLCACRSLEAFLRGGKGRGLHVPSLCLFGRLHFIICKTQMLKGCMTGQKKFCRLSATQEGTLLKQGVGAPVSVPPPPH